MSLMRIKITPYEWYPKHFDKRYRIRKYWYNDYGDGSFMTKFHPYHNQHMTKEDYIKKYDLIQNPNVISTEDPILGKMERSKVIFEIHSLDKSVKEEVWYCRHSFGLPHTEEEDISPSSELDEFMDGDTTSKSLMS